MPSIISIHHKSTTKKAKEVFYLHYNINDMRHYFFIISGMLAFVSVSVGQTSIFGHWVTPNQEGQNLKEIIIEVDSIDFDHQNVAKKYSSGFMRDGKYVDLYYHYKNGYQIDSIIGNNQYWISTYDSLGTECLKYFLHLDPPFLYVSSLKTKAGISDHWTGVTKYISMDAQNHQSYPTEMEDLIIRINKEIPLDRDCISSYQEGSNVFVIAYGQGNKENELNTKNEIYFHKEKFVKTPLKADIRHLSLQKYRFLHGETELRVHSDEEILINKRNIVAYFESQGIDKNDMIVRITRYNHPDRKDTNTIFGKNIVGQIQSFEIDRAECFLNRMLDKFAQNADLRP
jgi:hypothetical protein